MCVTASGIKGIVHLWPHINWILFWKNMAEYWNYLITAVKALILNFNKICRFKEYKKKINVWSHEIYALWRISMAEVRNYATTFNEKSPIWNFNKVCGSVNKIQSQIMTKCKLGFIMDQYTRKL
jgi:hypothetical protein